MTDGGSMSLAEASNAAIYATMVTLTVAMVLFAASFASGRRRTTSSSSVASRETAEGSVAVIDRVDTAVAAEPGRRLANVAMSLTWLATGLLTVGLVLRGLWAGRVPWGNMYEFSISSAWGVLVVFLVLSTRRDLRWLGLFVVTPALLTLGLAVTVLYTEAAQLVPALKSYWLVIHVSAAIICAGAFTVAASAAALSLVQSRREQRGLTWQGGDGIDAIHGEAADLHQSHHRFRFSPVDLRRDRRCHLGGERVGALLGLGPEGNLGLHHVGGLRRVPARPINRRVARESGFVDRNPRARDLLDQLLRRQHFRQQPAFLRRIVSIRFVDTVPRAFRSARPGGASSSCSTRHRPACEGSADHHRAPQGRFVATSPRPRARHDRVSTTAPRRRAAKR